MSESLLPLPGGSWMRCVVHTPATLYQSHIGNTVRKPRNADSTKTTHICRGKALQSRKEGEPLCLLSCAHYSPPLQLIPYHISSHDHETAWSPPFLLLHFMCPAVEMDNEDLLVMKKGAPWSLRPCDILWSSPENHLHGLPFTLHHSPSFRTATHNYKPQKNYMHTEITLWIKYKSDLCVLSGNWAWTDS